MDSNSDIISLLDNYVEETKKMYGNLCFVSATFTGDNYKSK